MLGRPICEHYLGVEIRDIHQGNALIDAAWVEPENLGCSGLVCA